MRRCQSCGEWWLPRASAHNCGTKVVSRDELRALREVAAFADHASWRCAHPDRYPWEPDGCPCGLSILLANLGIEVTDVAA